MAQKHVAAGHHGWARESRCRRLRGRYTTQAWGLPSTHTDTAEHRARAQKEGKRGLQEPSAATEPCPFLPRPLGGALSLELRTQLCHQCHVSHVVSACKPGLQTTSPADVSMKADTGASVCQGTQHAWHTEVPINKFSPRKSAQTGPSPEGQTERTSRDLLSGHWDPGGLLGACSP